MTSSATSAHFTSASCQMPKKPPNPDTDSLLSDADRALFRAEVADVTAQAPKAVPPSPPRIALPTVRHAPAQNASLRPAFSDVLPPEWVDNEAHLEFARDGVGQRQRQQLRRGAVHLEAELDLHGLTLMQALDALTEFFHACAQQRLRFVRVIHGKGWSSKHQQPVLKSKLNQWLRQSEQVLAFSSAPAHQGGTGAVLILLKRREPTASADWV